MSKAHDQFGDFMLRYVQKFFNDQILNKILKLASNDYKMIYKEVYFMIGIWRAAVIVATYDECMFPPECSVYGGVSEQ